MARKAASFSSCIFFAASTALPPAAALFSSPVAGAPLLPSSVGLVAAANGEAPDAGGFAGFVGLPAGLRKEFPAPPGPAAAAFPVPVPAPAPSVGLFPPNRFPMLGAEGAPAPAPAPDPLTGFGANRPRPPEGAVEVAVPAPVLAPGLGPANMFPPIGANGEAFPGLAPPEGFGVVNKPPLGADDAAGAVVDGAVVAGGFGVVPNRLEVLALVLGGFGADPMP